MEKEVKEKLRDEILTKYNFEKGQIIDFALFCDILKSYGDSITDRELSEILGIKYKTFFKFKTEGKDSLSAKVRILMDEELSLDEKAQIVLDIAEKYGLHKGKTVSYDEFRKMYEDVKRVLTEIEFADLLGIKGSNLRNIRNTDQRAKIFRNIELSEEKKKEIIASILDKYEGKRVFLVTNKTGSSVAFDKIYEPYKMYFSEIEFAALLGISEKNLSYMRHDLANPIVNNPETLRKIELIRNELKTAEFVSKERLETICANYEITQRDFINYFMNRGKFFDSDVYEDALENNEGLYIHGFTMTNADYEIYQKQIRRICGTIVGSEINKKYGETYYDDDLIAEMQLFILGNCGDIVANFGYDQKVMERMLWLRARKFAKIKFVESMKKDTKAFTFDENHKLLANKTHAVREDTRPLRIEEYQMDELLELFNEYLASRQIVLKSPVGLSHRERERITEENKKIVRKFMEEKQKGLNDE